MNQLAPASSHFSRFGALVDTAKGLLRPIGSVWTALQHRREVKALAELDERTLKDIGLSRGDVDGALSEPFFRNPSLVLVRCAEHRTRQPVRAPRRPAVPVVKIAG